MWTPDRMQHKKAVSAACADLSCRFVKEASAKKAEMLADVDFLDVTVRQESMNNVPGQETFFLLCVGGGAYQGKAFWNNKTGRQPIQIQLGVVPCYALTLVLYCVHIFLYQLCVNTG